MNSGPQKPCIHRPSGLSCPEVLAVGRPAAATNPITSKISFLTSLGFHGCLLAAACSITFMHSTDEGLAGDETSRDPAGFEMTSAADRQPAAEKAVTNASSLPRRRLPIMVVNSSATLQLPPVEPMASITPNNKPAAAAPAPAATGKSLAGVDHAAAKPTDGKGAGRGKATHRDRPVPPPRLVSAPPPSYPAAAKAARKSGMVGVLVRVRGNGSAAATSVYQGSGNPQLDQAAVAAARWWKFSATPSLGPGETVAVVVQVTFKL